MSSVSLPPRQGSLRLHFRTCRQPQKKVGQNWMIGRIVKPTLPALSRDPLDLLSQAEFGEAREVISEQCQSPSRGSGMSTLFLLRMDNPTDFLLSRESSGAEFLMFTRFYPEKRIFQIYHHSPLNAGFVEDSPDFKLSWNEDGKKWVARMCAERIVCETCLYRGRNASFFEEKPVVLQMDQGIQHSTKGSQHWFYMDISGVSTANWDRFAECRQCQHQKRDTAGGLQRTLPELRLHSTSPTQTSSGDLSIRFLTRGRTIVPSARNLQVVNSTPDGVEVVMQFLKLSSTRFNVDFKAPLSPIQALCLALSTHFWK